MRRGERQVSSHKPSRKKDMKKKIIVLTFCAMFFALCFSAQAQEPKKVPRIGVIFTGFPSTATPLMEAFRDGLRDLGYIQGKNIVIEYRYGEGKEDRLVDTVAELVRLKVDIIVVAGGNATLAAKNATKTIPIVMAVASDPVGAGLVASLARPGGNLTGSSLINPDLTGKRLELLKEAIPKLIHVAVLTHRDNPAATLLLKESETAGQSLGLQLQILEVRGSRRIRERIWSCPKSALRGHQRIVICVLNYAQEKNRGIGR
jgi:putative tryptophan/tyrosine transport system substrate-binding protein